MFIGSKMNAWKLKRGRWLNFIGERSIVSDMLYSDNYIIIDLFCTKKDCIELQNSPGVLYFNKMESFMMHAGNKETELTSTYRNLFWTVIW